MQTLTKMVFAAASLLCTATTAFAADAPTWSLSGAVDIQSDYRFRGISQSNRNPVPQGTLNLTGPDGFYVGTWLSKINWQLNGPAGTPLNDNPSIEWDIYGGKHFDLDGTDLNVEAYEYAYPDASQANGSPEASYFEGIIQLSHTFGPLALTGTFAISPQFSLGGGQGTFFGGTAVYTIVDWLSVSTNIGHQDVDAAPAGYTYEDIGATATWKAFSLDARYVNNDIGKKNCANFWMGTKNACGSGFIATLTYTATLAP
jgi:uncharacterized protein (TIGR02001 family)